MRRCFRAGRACAAGSTRTARPGRPAPAPRCGRGVGGANTAIPACCSAAAGLATAGPALTSTTSLSACGAGVPRRVPCRPYGERAAASPPCPPRCAGSAVLRCRRSSSRAARRTRPPMAGALQAAGTARRRQPNIDLSPEVAARPPALRPAILYPAIATELGLAAYRTSAARHRGRATRPARARFRPAPTSARLAGHTATSTRSRSSPDGRTLATAAATTRCGCGTSPTRHTPVRWATLTGHNE